MTTDTVTEFPKAEPMDKAVAKQIPIVEMFGPTIAGEGNIVGQQTYFIRTGLCDYKCTMCDSLHAVLPNLVKANSEWLTQEQIAEKFKYAYLDSGVPTTNWITISGGNPAIHDLTYLVGLLKMAGMRINVETQGTQYRGWLNKVDNLTISPKPPGMGEKHNHVVFQGFLSKILENGTWPTDTVNEWKGPQLCFKIPVFSQIDLEFAADVFLSIADHPLMEGIDNLEQYFYLSLGNPNPPTAETRNNDKFSVQDLWDQYRIFQEEIAHHPVLSRVRFLPQMHTLVWGNGDGH